MKVDKNVPIPNKGVSGKLNFISDMKKGESIFVENKNQRDSIRAGFKYRNLHCMTRREKNGWRIWRIDAEDKLF
jgi:hypothetical protein